MTIQLGMTDCPPVRRLLDSGALSLDYLEVHGPFAGDARRVYPQRPMLLHNALYQWSLVHPAGLEHQDCLKLTVERLTLTHSPWYSLHLGFSAAEVDFFKEAMHALTPTLTPGLIFDRTCACLTGLRRELGPSVPLLVENLDYNPTGAYETICTPAFIKAVVQQTGVYLLLDLAHARISAAALGLPVQDYLDLLPLDQVRQLHINRPLRSKTRWWDAHQDLQKEDIPLLQWVLNRTQPWALTLEYGREEEKILPQVQRLRQVLAGHPI